MLRIICFLAALAACSSVKSPNPTPNPDQDAAPPNDTAPPNDAVVKPPPLPSRQALVGGAGRLTSTTYTLDVEIGHSFDQRRVTGTSYRIEGNAAFKP